MCPVLWIEFFSFQCLISWMEMTGRNHVLKNKFNSYFDFFLIMFFLIRWLVNVIHGCSCDLLSGLSQFFCLVLLSLLYIFSWFPYLNLVLSIELLYSNYKFRSYIMENSCFCWNSFALEVYSYDVILKGFLYEFNIFQIIFSLNA